MAILVRCERCSATFRAKDSARGKKGKCPRCGDALVADGETVPNYDVFLSHSNKDKSTADAICAAFEAQRMRCWMAPRDIAPGASWSGSIIRAIEQCRVMVLIYSAHSNLSQQVLREVERAVSKNVVIVPFRIDETPMSKDMEYFLSASHWMDAVSGDMQRHVEELTATAQSIIKGTPHAPPAQPIAPTDAAARAVPNRKGLLVTLAAIVVVGMCIAVAALSGVFSGDQPPGALPPPAKMQTAELTPAQLEAGAKQLKLVIEQTITPDLWIGIEPYGDKMLKADPAGKQDGEGSGKEKKPPDLFGLSAICKVSIVDGMLSIHAHDHVHRQVELCLNQLAAAHGMDPIAPVFDQTPADRNVRERLEKREAAEMTETPLSDVCEYLTNLYGVPVMPNESSLNDQGLDIGLLVTMNLQQSTGYDILLRLTTCDEMSWLSEISYAIHDGAVHIGDLHYIQRLQHTRLYDTTGLLRAAAAYEVAREPIESVRKSMVDSIRPALWSDQGGRCTMFAVGSALLVRTIPRMHEAVDEALRQMRHAKGLEPAKPIMSESAATAATRTKLEVTGTLETIDVPFEEVLETLGNRADVPVEIRRSEFGMEGIDVTDPITINLSSRSTHRLLRATLDVMEADSLLDDEVIVYTVQDGVIVVVVLPDFEYSTQIKTYRLDGLVQEP